jgi:hypothetical protein
MHKLAHFQRLLPTKSSLSYFSFSSKKEQLNKQDFIAAFSDLLSESFVPIHSVKEGDSSFSPEFLIFMNEFSNES